MTLQTNNNPLNVSANLIDLVINELDFNIPYDNEGACTFKRITWLRKKGVYVIRCKETKSTLYVGRSRYCIYQKSYRHFTEWRKNNLVKGRYKDTWFNREEVELALFEYSTDCEILEVMLTAYFKPKYNRNLFVQQRRKPEATIFRNVEQEAYSEDYDLIEWFDSQKEVAA